MHTGWPLIAALCVMSVSLLGVVFVRGRFGAFVSRYLTYLATFSGGVFVVIAYFLAEEAVHEGGWIVGLSSVLLGAALMEGIRFFFPNKHHHHHAESDHSHSPIDGRQVLLSDGLHNIGDGILLVGAFAADIYVGIAATVGVILHETVQEISEYFVLRGAGYSNMQALSRNFAVSSTILIGLLFATYLSSIPVFLALLSGIAAGGFLSVVVHDLVPHAVASARSRGGAGLHGLVALLGISAMLGVQMLVPHEHEETHEHVETEAVTEIVPAQALEAVHTEYAQEESADADGVETTSSGETAATAVESTQTTPERTSDGGVLLPQ